MKNFLNIILFVGPSLFLFSCGGGGGGGGGSTANDYTTEFNNQPGLAMIGADTANDAGYTGTGVKVSVVDTGIETSHPEFSGKSIGGTSYVSGKSQYDDVNGHGSHVAGIIAANKNGTTSNPGMRGVAFGVSLMSQRIGNDAGSISFTDATWASVINTEKNIV